jgi:hypothetical protein
MYGDYKDKARSCFEAGKFEESIYYLEKALGLEPRSFHLAKAFEEFKVDFTGSL